MYVEVKRQAAGDNSLLLPHRFRELNWDNRLGDKDRPIIPDVCFLRGKKEEGRFPSSQRRNKTKTKQPNDCEKSNFSAQLSAFNNTYLAVLCVNIIFYTEHSDS